eukprot:COSAG05_NODE_716_length_7804_cov_2.669825_10_plen_190_part_00
MGLRRTVWEFQELEDNKAEAAAAAAGAEGQAQEGAATAPAAATDTGGNKITKEMQQEQTAAEADEEAAERAARGLAPMPIDASTAFYPPLSKVLTIAEIASPKTHSITRTHTHARARKCTHPHIHARARARTHTRTHARTRARAHTHARAHTRARARTHTLIDTDSPDCKLPYTHMGYFCNCVRDSHLC